MISEIRFNEQDWGFESALIIQNKVKNIIQKKNICNIFLTGGTAAEILYNKWSEIAEFKKTTNLVFYFGDERCVSPEDIHSNYGMSLRSLFKYGFPINAKIYRMEGEDSNIFSAAKKYELIIPETIDILLLGIGIDGHIASIFPDSEILFNKSNDLVLPVTVNKFPETRLTITPRVLKRAEQTFILAYGSNKYNVLNNIRNNEVTSYKYPVRLLTHSIWLTSKKT